MTKAILATLLGLGLVLPAFPGHAAESPRSAKYVFTKNASGAGVFMGTLVNNAPKTEREANELYYAFNLHGKSVTLDGRKYKRRTMPTPDASTLSISCLRASRNPNSESYCSFLFVASEENQIDVDGRVLLAHYSGPAAYAIYRSLWQNNPRHEFDWVSLDRKIRWYSSPDAFDFVVADPL